MDILTTEPVPTVTSCFLPDTNIQYAWDSTSLELFKRCPKLYHYVMIEGWQPHGEGIHLRFGIEYHQALHDYETYKVLELNHDEAVCATIRDLLLRIRDWDPDPRTVSEEKKSKSHLVRTIVWYLDQFKDDPAKTVMLDNGKPALEVSFRFQLDWGPETSLSTEGLQVVETREVEPSVRGGISYGPYEVIAQFPKGDTPNYLLCGHLDRIVNFQGALFVMDRKTSGTALSSYYFNQYHPHNQMSLYAIAGKIILDTPVKGVIIDAAYIFNDWTNANPFQRGVTYRTQDQMDEWFWDLSYWLKFAEECAQNDHWPQNDTSCDKYGGCRFRSICQKSPNARQTFLKSEFKQLEPEKRWNPLVAR